MKNLFNISAAVIAALVSFSSCKKVNEIEEAPKVTHTVKFTTEAPTKTSYVVEGTTVNYQWEEDDLNRIHVYEDGIEGTIDVEKSAIDPTYVMLTVDFVGTGEGSHKYTANLNEGIVKSGQVADGKYDSDCDVLVAKSVSSEDITDGIYTFQFRRPVAITELKLKGLKAGEKVGKVTIFSDADHSLVGKYTQSSTDDSQGEWGETSNKIAVTFGTEIDGETPKTKTVEDDGSLIVPIVSMPVESASVKVLVETESGLKYRKVTSKALTLIENNVKVQGIGLTQVTEAEHEEDGWYLVTDESELFDGDEIRIACPEKGMIAGEKTGEYLGANEATFTLETYAELTGVDSENRPNTFTLVENYGTFALVNANGKLGTTAAKKMSYDDGLTIYAGATEWTIAIDDNKLASIAAGDKGRIQYNANSPRFLNYASSPTTSQLLPRIYKKYGTPEDPIIKTARTASFSPETATVTIGANDNVFPELSFNPTEASDGTQTWTSSNTEVATVDEETGEVTLVSDGTTTIKVEIAESETYQPCSAEYVLTVKPAPVQGLDVIDNDFVGKPGSYSIWLDKVATNGSGNTYAGQSTTQTKTNNIQMRATDPSGIVVTASGCGKVARKVSVVWADGTASGRSVDIYGKNEAYTGTNGASDLYSESTRGTKLGSIAYSASTELTITGDYEYIGILPVGGALYVEKISIQWEDPKPEYELSFWDAMAEETITEYYATVEESGVTPVTNIKLRNGETEVDASNYESSNTDVADVESDGDVILKKKGDVTITATLNGDDTHRTTKASYTLHVANKLSSIKLAADSEQPTMFYVGQDFSFAGIKVEAEYSDGEKKTLTADDLTAGNFSGFDSSEAVDSQTITVSYTDGATKTTSYDIQIKPLVTLYGITVPEAVDGNSITVKGGLTQAAEGDEIELDVNLATGYKLTSLKVNAVEHSADVAEGKYTFTMPAVAVTVTASFSNLYTVTLTQPEANGTIKVGGNTTPTQQIACGTNVSVLAEPSDGYELDSWTITGATLADATSASTSFTMPANDVSITASFKKHVETQKIIINKTSSGVTINYSDPTFAIDGVTFNAKQWMSSTDFIQARASQNPSVCNSTPIPGIIKKVTVVTGSSKTARAVTVYGGSSSSALTDQISSPETDMTMVFDFTGKSYYYFKLVTPSNACYFDNITIEYEPGDAPEPTTYTLSLTQVTGGTISAEVEGEPVSTGAKIEKGKTVTIKAVASSGYSFTSWALPSTGLASSTSATTTFTMSADTEVKATFKEAGGGDTYVLCTATSDLVAGAKYIIASGTSGDVVCVSNVSNSNNRKTVAATVSDSKIDISGLSSIMTLTLGGSTGSWTLQTDNYLGTNGYLASATSGSNNYCRVIETTTTCTITFSSNAAVITLQPHSSRNILRYNPNNGSPIFACYSSGQSPIYLYKKSN